MYDGLSFGDGSTKLVLGGKPKVTWFEAWMGTVFGRR